MRANGTLYYLLTDHLGSMSLVIDTNGNQVESEIRYTAWGEIRDPVSGLNPGPSGYTFTGQFTYAEQFGLMYFNARFYDPALGRFSSADTLIPGAGDPQAWDRYAYSNNSPLNYVDPSGHWGQCHDDWSGYQCRRAQQKWSQAEQQWAVEAARLAARDFFDCRNLTCDSGVAVGGSTSQTLDMAGYSDWEKGVLLELFRRGGPEAVYGVKYILANGIHIRVGSMWEWQGWGAAAGWFAGNEVVLNPRVFSAGAMPSAWGLATLIHEAKHIEQGKPLTKYKELEAWQITFRIADRLGHYTNGIDPYSTTQKILDLSLSPDQSTINQFSRLVWEYDKWYWIPFYTLPDR
jgi:RHS repeat-associated protein